MYVITDLSPHTGSRAALAISLLLLTGCLNPCGNRILSDVPSPNATKHAVIFERDCGATTDFSTQLSILSEREQLDNKGGNTFVADSNHGRAHSVYVNVKWSGEDRLTVIYPAAVRVFHNEQRVNGVTVVFRPDPER
jgi:hypothetical protein